MRTPMLVLLTSAVLLLALGAGSALASTPAVQAAGQSASTTQSASANANAQQLNPTNSVIDVRIGSPGDSGAITQTNDNTASAASGSTAQTGQSATQAAGGAGVQSADQTAGTGQAADAAAQAVQVDPSNEAISVRIHSDGTDGPVTQANGNAARAQAGNTAATGQQAGQTQTGDGGGRQDAGQQATTDQGATATAGATQDHPRNEVIRVRIHSPGDDGAVDQSNDNLATAQSGSRATTGQDTAQTQGDAGVQSADQQATTGQSATANADAVQSNPSNVVESVRLHSPGDDGDITQANRNGAGASAANDASTTQSLGQEGSVGQAVQAAGQSAGTDQSAGATANATQDGALNRVDGPGGSVSQVNDNLADAAAGNTAATGQSAWQTASGPAVQAAGQEAWTEQPATAAADALQRLPVNLLVPVALWPAGAGGPVEQASGNAGRGEAANDARTGQELSQLLP